MSNVVDFQEWKDRKCTKSINKVFGETFLPYLFTHDPNDVVYTVTVEGEDYFKFEIGEDYCIENLFFDGNLFDPK